MSRNTRVTNEQQIYNAYSLSLLSEYTHTLDSLPLDLSRNFADLRELDAVLSSQMASITAKIKQLTSMIEEGNVSKKDRLMLLENIAQEASNLKIGGDDKIRVACQAADNLKLHTGHMKSLLGHLPSFDMSVLNRKTTYPHVATRSFQPLATTEAGRRRRGAGGIMSIAPDPSPVKRKRVVREEDYEIITAKTPRRERVTEVIAPKPRPGGRKRAASPAESLLSVTSHPHQQPQASSSRGGNHALNRAANTSNGSKRTTKPRQQDGFSNEETGNDHPRGRDMYSANSTSAHPSGGHANGNINGSNGYDNAGGGGDWGPAHIPAGQLEGPGMPVSRSSSHPATVTGAVVHASSNKGAASQAGVIADDGGAAEGGDGEGDGDDRTYCFCESVSYGEMIACDEDNCEREWFHLACIGLTVPPEGTWYCDTCRAKRNAKRGGRGGKRRTAGGRAGAKAGNGA